MSDKGFSDTQLSPAGFRITDLMQWRATQKKQEKEVKELVGAVDQIKDNSITKESFKQMNFVTDTWLQERMKECEMSIGLKQDSKLFQFVSDLEEQLKKIDQKWEYRTSRLLGKREYLETRSDILATQRETNQKLMHIQDYLQMKHQRSHLNNENQNGSARHVTNQDESNSQSRQSTYKQTESKPGNLPQPVSKARPAHHSSVDSFEEPATLPGNALATKPSVPLQPPSNKGKLMANLVSTKLYSKVQNQMIQSPKNIASNRSPSQQSSVHVQKNQLVLEQVSSRSRMSSSRSQEHHLEDDNCKQESSVSKASNNNSSHNSNNLDVNKKKQAKATTQPSEAVSRNSQYPDTRSARNQSIYKARESGHFEITEQMWNDVVVDVKEWNDRLFKEQMNMQEIEREFEQKLELVKESLKTDIMLAQAAAKQQQTQKQENALPNPSNQIELLSMRLDELSGDLLKVRKEMADKVMRQNNDRSKEESGYAEAQVIFDKTSKRLDAMDTKLQTFLDTAPDLISKKLQNQATSNTLDSMACGGTSAEWNQASNEAGSIEDRCKFVCERMRYDLEQMRTPLDKKVQDITKAYEGIIRQNEKYTLLYKDFVLMLQKNLQEQKQLIDSPQTFLTQERSCYNSQIFKSNLSIGGDRSSNRNSNRLLNQYTAGAVQKQINEVELSLDIAREKQERLTSVKSMRERIPMFQQKRTEKPPGQSSFGLQAQKQQNQHQVAFNTIGAEALGRHGSLDTGRSNNNKIGIAPVFLKRGEDLFRDEETFGDGQSPVFESRRSTANFHQRQASNNNIPIQSPMQVTVQVGKSNLGSTKKDSKLRLAELYRQKRSVDSNEMNAMYDHTKTVIPK